MSRLIIGSPKHVKVKVERLAQFGALRSLPHSIPKRDELRRRAGASPNRSSPGSSLSGANSRSPLKTVSGLIKLTFSNLLLPSSNKYRLGSPRRASPPLRDPHLSAEGVCCTSPESPSTLRPASARDALTNRGVRRAYMPVLSVYIQFSHRRTPCAPTYRNRHSGRAIHRTFRFLQIASLRPPRWRWVSGTFHQQRTERSLAGRGTPLHEFAFWPRSPDEAIGVP